MTGLPMVSVVVPVRDDDRLADCLRALAAQDYPRHLYEVIVVDNGSRHDPCDVVSRFPDVRLLREPTPGSYAARNTGVRAATGEVLAFTDADCTPSSDWLSCATAAIVSGCDVVAGHVEVYARRPRRPSPVEAYEVVHGFPQELYVARGACATANMVTSKTWFDRIGLFTASLRSGGDIEWTRRATRAGAVLRFVPEARVRHPARRTTREIYVKSRRVQQGARAKARLAGRPEAPRWPGSVELRPPLGAVGRARRADLPSLLARVAYVAGAVVCRYAAAAAQVTSARGRANPPV